MKPHNHTDYQKRFFKEVKKQFPFYGKREKEYLKQFQTEIDAYLEEFPDSSYEAMLEAIGTPKDVVENYFQNVEDRYQLSHMKKSNYISEHYSEIAKQTHIFKDEHITNRAKENLDIIGRVYDYE